MPERRTVPRKKFKLYLRVMNDDTGEQMGHVIEVSATGLQLETSAPLPLEKDYYLRLELTSELADRPYIVFIARSKWCRADAIQPNLCHIGFAVAEILPEDKPVFVNLVKKSGG
jgi:hypothetical protein